MRVRARKDKVAEIDITQGRKDERIGASQWVRWTNKHPRINQLVGKSLKVPISEIIIFPCSELEDPAISDRDKNGKLVFMAVREREEGHADLPQIAYALRSPGPLANLFDARQQERREDGDKRDDQDQFDEGDRVSRLR